MADLRGREKHVLDGTAGVHKDQRVGGGPSGSGSAFGGKSGGSGGGPSRGPGNSKLALIIGILVVLLGGGGGLGGLLGGHGGSSQTGAQQPAQTSAAPQTQTSTGGSSATTALAGLGGLSSIFGNVSNTSTGWLEGENNTGKLDKNVSPEAREKFTTLKGNGDDTITLMVYMCGTDLESKHSMATRDLTEMTDAALSDKINLLVYTGGCTQWQNNVISNRTNQIYRIENGGLKVLEKDLGAKAMTDPATLTDFIKYCNTNYPADRNMLIFWDHGGGSISGYGYDEKYPKSGSMDLSGIDKALKNAGIKYDFVGFDACLMATVETDLMLSQYADYAISSEETEPGVGWFYTNWLNALSKNTSMPTIEIGKNIIDDFVTVCDRNCPGQKTTLSIVDLAELGETVTDEFKAFAKGTTELIKNKQYKAVSDARSSSREFASSSRIDQIDLVNFAKGLGTEEGKSLSETLLSAVKYNRTSPNMTNAYGISIYFPYQRASNVDRAVNTYSQIGIDSEYSDCIREFANLEISGQVSTGGTASPFGSLTGGGASGSSLQTLTTIMNLMSAMSSGRSLGIDGLDSSNTAFLNDRALSEQETAEYIEANQFDGSALTWSEDSDGKYISLPAEQWELVNSVNLNSYYDDGEGYVDLGLDNLYTITDDGKLYADTDKTWLSIGRVVVAYYHTDTVSDGDKYSISGYVPAYLNGENVHLILIFDNEHPDGFIAGADPDYDEALTETSSRGLAELKPGDEIKFLYDYYSYDGTFDSGYTSKETLTVTEEPFEIGNIALDRPVKSYYKFTDLYNQEYWSQEL
ncbi:MAG: peptidase C11 [Lachnospiraceae bacterium]|nr:peptidase C11 [Lachnospiraceae bacterium]